MTDEELISTLWGGEVTLSTVAAAAVRIKDLNAKLAKAADVLVQAVKWTEQYKWAAPWPDDARAVLYEIKRETK